MDYIQKKKEFIEALDWGAFHRADEGINSYHYTSLEGMKSILNSNTVYATEYHFLNDEEELRYIDKIANKVFADFFGHTTKGKLLNQYVKEHLKRLRNEMNHPENSYYVVCFSKKKDNLTLWSEFARFGCNFQCNPYAIFTENAIYGSVVYDLRGQRELILKILDIVFKHFELSACLNDKKATCAEIANLDEIQLNIMAECIAELVIYYGTLVKRELYEAEQEFRVVIKGKEQEIKYRLKENMFIPYIEVPIEEDIWIGKTLTLAPLNHKERCKSSVKLYLDSLGYKNINVKYSEIRLQY